MGEGFPLWSMVSMAWRGESPSEIGSVSLSLFVSAFPDSGPSPFLKFPEIRNSDWAKFWANFHPDISFVAAKEGHQPPYGVATRAQGAPLTLVGHSYIVLGWFRFPKFTYIPKKSPSVFIPFGLRLICIFCETKNMQQIGTDTGTGSIC